MSVLKHGALWWIGGFAVGWMAYALLEACA